MPFEYAELDADAPGFAVLERDLRAALAADQFRIHWQPIVTCRDGDLLGFEALVRWDRPGFGAVPPSIFIPVLERLGLYQKLDCWVLRQACAAAAVWPARYRVAVNVSARWFEGPGLTAAIAAALEESGIDPGPPRDRGFRSDHHPGPRLRRRDIG